MLCLDYWGRLNGNVDTLIWGCKLVSTGSHPQTRYLSSEIPNEPFYKHALPGILIVQLLMGEETVTKIENVVKRSGVSNVSWFSYSSLAVKTMARLRQGAQT